MTIVDVLRMFPALRVLEQHQVDGAPLALCNTGAVAPSFPQNGSATIRIFQTKHIVRI